MDYRELNRKVMDNTQDLCGKLNFLISAVQNSIAKEYIVYQNDDISFNEVVPCKEMKICANIPS